MAVDLRDMADVKAATVDERTHELWSFKDAAKLDDEATPRRCASPVHAMRGAARVGVCARARARARTIERAMQHALAHSRTRLGGCSR